MYQGNNPIFRSNVKIDVPVFNGVSTTFTLTTGGNPLVPVSSESLLIFVNDVRKRPGIDYTLNTSKQLQFSVAPLATDTFHGIAMGQPVQMLDAVAKTGDIMTGFLSLSAPPTQAMHAVNKQYIDTNYLGSSLTLSQLNSAVNDADVTSLTGIESLTNKTLISPVITDNIVIINSNTTAVRGRTYVLNVAGITLTLPISPSVNDVVSVINGNFSTCVIARNGSNIMSLAEDMTLDAQRVSFDLVYLNSTIGWTIK
jgi:hypothetical protein